MPGEGSRRQLRVSPVRCVDQSVESGQSSPDGFPQQEWWGAWVFLGLAVVSGAWAARQFVLDARQSRLR